MPLNRWVTRGLRSDRRASPKPSCVGAGVAKAHHDPGALEELDGRGGTGQLRGERHHPDRRAAGVVDAGRQPGGELVGRGQAQVGGVVCAPVRRVQEGPLDVAPDDR